MSDTDVRWTVAQRYEFIEWRVYWTGRVNRKDLETRFQISTPQASIDLREYQEAAQGNIEYNGSEKAYMPTPNFRPVFLKLSPERYLLQLQAIKSGAVRKRDTWFDDLPPVDTIPAIAREPHAYVLRAVLQAIETRSSIDIYYRSLTSTGRRTICPHALVSDGNRWHCRAYSVERGEFRDYVLGRILSFWPLEPCEIDPSDDLEWTTEIELKLRTHPHLSDEQRETIKHDLLMDDGQLRLKMRLAVAFYFVKRHNLDLQDDGLPASRLQIWLDNLAELNEALRSAKEKSKILVAQRLAKGTPQSSAE